MADHEQLEINLKLLSPSTGIEGGLHLPNLPASTTVRELRQRIQDAVPTRPATEHMRLIYRGRVVANDADTLQSVFGADNIRESKDQSLHLVLRELHPPPVNTASAPPSTSTSTSASSSPGPRATTAPPSVLRPVQGPLLPNTPSNNPFRSSSQPQLQQPHPHHHPHNHPHHHHHHHHHAAHLPSEAFSALPPHLREQMQRQLAHNSANAGTSPIQTPPIGGSNPPGDGPQQQQQQPPPGGFGFMPNATRVVRHQTIGPNGERWTVTYNDINLTGRPPQPLLPRPFPHPPGFPLPARPAGPPAPTGDIDQTLNQISLTLHTATQAFESAIALSRSPGSLTVPAEPIASWNPPSWRLGEIRRNVQILTNLLDSCDRSFASILSDPSMAQNRNVLALQQTARELRSHAGDLNGMLNRFGSDNTPSRASLTAPTISSGSTTSSVSTTVPQSTPSQLQPLSANVPTQEPDVPTELFILSSPQGPVGVLFDQRGMYRTPPMVSTLPFQTFTDQFAQNRQLIAGLGQQIAHNTAQLQNQLIAARQQQAVINGQPAADQAQNPAPNQDQNINQNQAAVPNANPQGDNDRMALIAGHLWLVFKLACFVYIFAGGGGWYRPTMMCIIAIGVYVAQLGIFENQFNIVRRHFEALLPLADRAVQDRNRPGQGANGQDQQHAGANRNITPEDAARRLLQQHRDERLGWVRESMRTVERSFAIFVASLWPGIGERMVQAQEERLRAERAAEEERQRLEEEAGRREAEQAEAQQNSNEKKEEPSVHEDGESSEPSASTSKGKKKVEFATETETVP